LTTLCTLLTAAVLAAPPKPGDAPGLWTKPAVPLLDHDAAWKKLPPAQTPKSGPLPTWARMLARALPNTTAAMLEFDRVHRLESPLEPKLRARLRWHAADANRCEYARQAALLDLKIAGADSSEIAALEKRDASVFDKLPENERRALELVRQVTVKGADLTDKQFQAVLDAYGEKNTVAIVLLTAGANWQDRLFLALGVPPEESGPMPPLQVKFDKQVKPEVLPQAPERVMPANRPAEDWTPAQAFGVDWGGKALTDLRGEMEKQKARPPRIRVPSAEEYTAANAKTPTRPGQQRRVPKIVWSLVCGGYQPELAAAWGGNTSSFRNDAKQDRVFEESLFWVVTRSIDCFY
jgi:alkylhydroperoxidase family enzyme